MFKVLNKKKLQLIEGCSLEL
ncbi:bacteriocin [Flavobacterium sp. KS-LB2]